MMKKYVGNFTLSVLLLAGFTLAILSLNTEHEREISDLKEQIQSCESPGMITFPNGEYFIVRYYPLNN